MASSAPGTHRGGCHCGAVRWELRTALPPSRWSVRACQCAFCKLHGGLSTSDPDGEIRFRVEQPEHLVRYRFGTRSADFLVCGRCGVYVGATMSEPDGAWAIVNARTLDHDGAASLPAAQPMSYEGETAQERRLRRRARWSPLVPRELESSSFRGAERGAP